MRQECEKVIKIPDATGMINETFVPTVLAEQVIPNRSLLWSETRSENFETAIASADQGTLVLLRGSYTNLLNNAMRDLHTRRQKLSELRHIPVRIALVCTRDKVKHCLDFPVLKGLRRILPIPDYWWPRQYLVPVRVFADLMLRQEFATYGLAVPGLKNPLRFKVGVFIPDLELVNFFLSTVAELRCNGIDDFKNKHVCDTFSGSGVFGFLADTQGIRGITCVDKDPLAVSSILDYSKLYPPECKFMAVKADLFPSKMCVDTIVANPPWKTSQQDYGLGHQFRDPDGVTINRFLQKFRMYLRPGGVVYLFYGRERLHVIRELSSEMNVSEYSVSGKGVKKVLFRIQT